jgi:hypothetical protein
METAMKRQRRAVVAAALLLAFAAGTARAGDGESDDTLYRTLARWACATYVTFEGLLAGTSMTMCWMTNADFQPSP